MENSNEAGDGSNSSLYRPPHFRNKDKNLNKTTEDVKNKNESEDEDMDTLK
jgi:hypothetical protein